MANLKCLGAVLVLFALSAVAASAAQAGEYESENNVYPTAFTGEQIKGNVTSETIEKHIFKTHAGPVVCKVAKFSGEIKAKETAQTIKPEYKECTLAGIGATVNLNECDYVLTAGETVGGSPDVIRNAVHVVCPAGKKIEVVSGNCVLSVPGASTPGRAGASNQYLSNITAEDETSATPFMAIIGIIDVEKIAYSTNGKCPNDSGGVGGSYTDGTYKGVATLKSSARGITVT